MITTLHVHSDSPDAHDVFHTLDADGATSPQVWNAAWTLACSLSPTAEDQPLLDNEHPRHRMNAYIAGQIAMEITAAFLQLREQDQWHDTINQVLHDCDSDIRREAEDVVLALTRLLSQNRDVTICLQPQ
jgi:hypothetical protein